MVAVQPKVDTSVCSSIGDINKHEEFKKLSKQKRINKLQEIYDKYGVRSSEFFIQVKPFIMWTIYRNLRGMPTTYLEDLVNEAYAALIIAFEGGDMAYYNRKIHQEPIYGTEYYYKRFSNIGDFVMNITGSSVVKYKSKTYRRQEKYENAEYDISDKLGFTDFEFDCDLYDVPEYELKKEKVTDVFKYFTFNDNMKTHLSRLMETKPSNNTLYNFMLWKESIDE